MLLLRLIYRSLRRTIRSIIGYPVIYNAAAPQKAGSKKKALLIYLVEPFLIKAHHRRFRSHQNLSQCRQIAQAISEFGFTVDVVDVADRKFCDYSSYDLIVSHRVALNEPKSAFKPGAKKIYLNTGMNHITHNNNTYLRYSNLRERRQCNLKVRRLVDEVMPFVMGADAIIGFGNDYTMGTWQKFFNGPIYTFNNYGFAGTEFSTHNKNYGKSRKNFLFFASYSQVGKGLDLLLEIFPRHPELNLYICSNYEAEKDFCDCYKQELFHSENIFPMGWVKINSSTYRELTRKCTFIILPTCSDASAGSVVQCMHTGLIPIVTREAGIDTDDFGITLEDDRISTIEKTILEVSAWPEKKIREHSVKTVSDAKNKFSESAFEKRIRQILSTILA